MLALGSQSAWLIKRHGQRTFGLGSVVASFSLDEIEVVAGQPSPLDIIVKFNGEELFGPGQYLREIKAYLARR